MLKEKIIETLVKNGAKRWTKGTMDRLYINPETVGFEFEYNSRGKLYGATNGEHSYNEREAWDIKNSKTYIDIETGKISYTNKTMFEVAQMFRDNIIAEVEAAQEPASQEPEESAKIENSPSLHALTDDQLSSLQYNTKMALTEGPYDADREAALQQLHEIRLEAWTRNWGGTPKPGERENYERHLARENERYEKIRDTGDLGKIYTVRNLIWTAQDRLAWLDSMKV